MAPLYQTSELSLFSPEFLRQLEATFYETKVQCGFTGFPSPADDHLQNPLDLNQYLNVRPTSTFYVRASGQSMIDAGIDENDLLVVERRLDPKHGSIAVCIVDGELVVKRIEFRGGKLYLVSANKSFAPILIDEHNELLVWGVVSAVIKKMV